MTRLVIGTLVIGKFSDLECSILCIVLEIIPLIVTFNLGQRTKTLKNKDVYLYFLLIIKC